MTLDNAFQFFTQIETKNLILRKIHSEDSESLFRILSDDEVTKYYDDETFQNISQAREQIDAWENGYKNRRCIRWGIAHKDDPTLIGSCGFYGLHTWHMRAGIGYELARPFWRQGIMTEALRAILHFGFQELNLNRIEAVVMPENHASIKLLEKFGLHYEGLLREYENWGNKGFADLCMLSIIKKSWEDSALEREAN